MPAAESVRSQVNDEPPFTEDWHSGHKRRRLDDSRVGRAKWNDPVDYSLHLLHVAHMCDCNETIVARHPVTPHYFRRIADSLSHVFHLARQWSRADHDGQCKTKLAGIYADAIAGYHSPILEPPHTFCDAGRRKPDPACQFCI